MMIRIKCDGMLTHSQRSDSVRTDEFKAAGMPVAILKHIPDL